MPVSLLREDADGLTFMRHIGAGEEAALRTAIGHCRRYARRRSARFVSIGVATWADALTRLRQPMRSNDALVAAHGVEDALVVLLSLWRMFVDHTRHDLSRRFGALSAPFQTFERATNQAYDDHAGYRLIEGLRSYVQHVEMPGLIVNRLERFGAPGEPEVVVEASIRLPREGLLAWDRCPRLLRRDLESNKRPVPVEDLVADALEAFDVLVRVVREIDEPEINLHVIQLQRLVDEAVPGVPVLADVGALQPDGGPLPMLNLSDLAHLLDLSAVRR